MTLITLTKDGRPLYRVRWNYQRDPDTGKQTYDEREFRRKRDAVAWNNQHKPGVTADTERITVAQLHAAWTNAHADQWKMRTRGDRKTQYERRIRPFLGAKRVASLTPALLGKWQEWMLEQNPTGLRAANKSLDDLKAAVRWGRSKGLCTNQLVDDARRLKTPKPKPANPYTTAEVQRIAAGCRHLRDETIILVAAYTGLRWSELRGLKWGDIDWTPGAETINLVRSIDLDRSETTTKSDEAREVPILGPGVVALKAWREVAPENASGWVFPNRHGRPMASKEWWERTVKIREACGIRFDLHELRDTYASILIQTTGIGEAELTMWLGHVDVQTTISRYGKLFAKRKISRAQLATAALARGDF